MPFTINIRKRIGVAAGAFLIMMIAANVGGAANPEQSAEAHDPWAAAKSYQLQVELATSDFNGRGFLRGSWCRKADFKFYLIQSLDKVYKHPDDDDGYGYLTDRDYSVSVLSRNDTGYYRDYDRGFFGERIFLDNPEMSVFYSWYEGKKKRSIDIEYLALIERPDGTLNAVFVKGEISKRKEKGIGLIEVFSYLLEQPESFKEEFIIERCDISGDFREVFPLASPK